MPEHVPDPEHRRTDETPEWWFSMIDLSIKIAKDVAKKDQRRTIQGYYDAAHENLVETAPDDSKTEADGFRQVNLLYLPRHKEWTKSQAYDRTPEVRFPRTGPHGNILGEFCEELAEQIGRECGELDQYRLTTDDVMAYGAYALWYEIDGQITSRTNQARLNLSPEQAMGIVLAGIDDPGVEYAAYEGQDHELFASVFRAQSENPRLKEDPKGSLVKDALIEAAGLHEIQAAQDAKTIVDVRHLDRNEVWCRRMMVGRDFGWDPYVDSFWDSRFVWRRVTMDVDVARDHKMFKMSLRKKLMPGSLDPDEGWRPLRALSKSDSEEKILSNKVIFYNIKDRKYQQSRWIVRGVDSFLEIDPADPHDGAIPKFFPVAFGSPNQSREPSPERPHGKPGQLHMVPPQRQIIRYASYDDEAVRKQSVRQTYGIPLGSMESDITSGVTGKHIAVDETYLEAFLAGRELIRAIDYGNVPRELAQRIDMYVVHLARLGAWPLSQLTGEPQSNTATGESIAVEGGQSQMGDLIREMQATFGRGQDVKLALAQKWYTEAQLMKLMPASYFDRVIQVGAKEEPVSVYDLFMEMSFEGVQATAKFTPIAQNEDINRRNQIREAFEFYASQPGPAPGLPMYGPRELMPLSKEYAKTFGLQAPEPTKYTPEQIEEAVARAEAQSQRGGQNKGEGKQKRATQTSKLRAVPGRIAAGNQRVG